MSANETLMIVQLKWMKAIIGNRMASTMRKTNAVKSATKGHDMKYINNSNAGFI